MPFRLTIFQRGKKGDRERVIGFLKFFFRRLIPYYIMGWNFFARHRKMFCAFFPLSYLPGVIFLRDIRASKWKASDDGKFRPRKTSNRIFKWADRPLDRLSLPNNSKRIWEVQQDDIKFDSFVYCLSTESRAPVLHFARKKKKK